MDILLLQIDGQGQAPLTATEWWTLGIGMLITIMGIAVVKNWVAFTRGYGDLPGWMRWPAATIFGQDVTWPNEAALLHMQRDREMRQHEYAKLKAKRAKQAAKQAVRSSAKRQAEPPVVRREVIRREARPVSPQERRDAYRERTPLPIPVVPSVPEPQPVLPLPAPVVEQPAVASSFALDVPVGVAVSQDQWLQDTHESVIQLIVVGETDAGKSSTVLPIVSKRLEHGEQLVIIDPHAEQNEWGDVKPYVVGWGRNFGEINTWLSALMGEMNRRYKLPKNHPDRGLPITVVVDEVIAIQEHCKVMWGQIISTFTSEARKVGMRLILLSQSDQVESLGLGGRGDLRGNLSFLRLGAKVKIPRRDGDMWPASLECPKLYGAAETLVDRTNLHKRSIIQIGPQHLWFPEVLPVTEPIKPNGARRPWAARSLDDIRAGITVDFDVLDTAVLAGLTDVDNEINALVSLYPHQKTMWYINQVKEIFDIGSTKDKQIKTFNEALRRIQHIKGVQQTV